MNRVDRTTRLAQLLGLSALAVAQPAFDVLGRNATFFAAHKVEGLGLVAFALLLVTLPAMLIFAVEELCGVASAKLPPIVHAAMVGVLTATALLPFAWHDATPLAAALLAASVAVVAALAYAMLAVVRRFLTVMALCAVAFPLLFLAQPSMRGLVAGRVTAVSGVVVSRPAPIVLIVFDGLRLVELLDEHGEIDGARYPGFARLARSSTWYRNATSVAAFTHQAVPAILTGRYARTGAAPAAVASSYPQNLFTLLGGAYDVTADEPVTRLCPDGICHDGARATAGARAYELLADTVIVWLHVVLPEACSTSLPDITGKWAGFGASGTGRAPVIFAKALETVDRSRAFTSFLERMSPETKLPLYFHHSLLPHNPFEFFPSGKRYHLPDRRLREVSHGYDWTDDAAGVQFEEELYVMQLSYVDRLVGRLLDRLAQLGIYDDALLIVTADHGFSFLAGHSQRHLSEQTKGDIVPVPLFIKVPGQREGRISDDEVETIDIVPTIAAMVGVDLPWPVDGRAVSSATEPRSKRFYDNGHVTRFTSMSAERDAALRRKLAQVASGSGAYVTLYGSEPVTPDAEVASSMPPAAAPAPYIVELTQRQPAPGVPDGRFVDGAVIGSSAPSDADRIVIAVRGRVAAVAPIFESPVTSTYAFEAPLDDRVACPGCPLEVLFWDARDHHARKPWAVESVSTDRLLDQPPAERLWRDVWSGSSQAYACLRRVREPFAAHARERMGAAGVFAPYRALERAVRDCAAQMQPNGQGTDGGTDLPATACACGPFAAGGKTAEQRLSRASSVDAARWKPAEGDEDGTADELWHDVWADSDLEESCDAVRGNFEELYRGLMDAGSRYTIAPYEVLKAAVEICGLEVRQAAGSEDDAEVARRLRNCACGPFGPPQPPADHAAGDAVSNARDRKAVKTRLLLGHLRRNGALPPPEG